MAEVAVHERFEQQVERFADRPAVHSAGRCVTYGQLNAAANQMAHAIADRLGAGGQVVALLVEQGVPLVTAMLGAMKAGQAFIPIDPTYPPQRIGLMLDDANPDAVITNRANAALAASLAGDRPILNLDQCDGQEDNLRLPVQPTDLAYILYTSGSTGRPKGVMQDHRSVVHNMLRHRLFFDITEHDRQTLLYPCSVYGGVRDTFNALLNGAGLYHYPIRDAGHLGLGDWLTRHQITIYCSVATVFRYFARELSGRDLFPHLRLVKLGGEAPYRGDVQLFQSHFSDEAVLFCGLGSTETGMSRRYPIVRDTVVSGAGVPLGYAVPGVDVLLLDEDRRPVAPGQVGELVIRSRYITCGYRGRDELNAQVLLPDPEDPQSRIFLTGDLGVMDERRCLIHKGRKDQQVKIRGNRVELPEIETALAGCAGVRDAVVNVRTNERGDTQLVAYVVPTRLPPPSVHALRDSLKQRLPHFMVPNLFVPIEALPLTPNGKIDRRALPDPDEAHALTDPEAAEPRNELERQLLAILRRVLNRQRVGVTDSFFDVGGDSMLAVRMVLEIEKQLEQTLPLASFYDAPSVRQLAELLERRDGEAGTEAVVTLRTGGDRAALFCLPGRGGTVFSYRGLARLLKADRPVYGLPFPGLGEDDEPIADVQQLAAEMVHRVRGVQPAGPYLLIGYSFGGLVAYEMARQFRRSGQVVAYLALLDTTAPNALSKRPLRHRVGLHLKRWVEADARGKARYLAERVGNVVGRLRGNESSSAGPVMQQGYAPEGEGRLIDALQRMHDAAEAARANYRPGPFDGVLHLFRSAAKPQWLEFCELEADYGWGDLVAGGVWTYDIPGVHMEVFDAAHVPALAEQVRATLPDV